MKHSTKKSSKNRRQSKKSDLRNAVSVKLPEDYPWKVLEKLTNDLKQYLDVESLEKLTLITRNRDFEQYLALSEAWGLQSIGPADTCLEAIRAKYLLASLLKKFQFPSDKAQRVARATEIFFEAERTCKTYNLYGYKELVTPETDWGVDILHHARVFLKRLLGDRLPGHLEMLSRSRHGPGATIGTKKGNTSQYHKFAEWPYSCTIDAYRYARFAIETDPRWFGALQDSYREASGISKHFPISMSEFWSAVINVVDSNRIAFVPKSALKERTIAIEPSLNLYLQLGVDGYFRKRLKRYGVDLNSQTKNQRLARLGSLVDDESSYVTIDLAAASDTISVKLCESLLPKAWYTYLMDLRAPNGALGDEKFSYEKISSMGNGYTFALESALFAALVYAVTKSAGESFNHEEFAVFGDDIVVHKRLYFQMVEALRLSGLKVNSEKTFSSGPVRESCGTDWFRGKALRPVFFDSIPTSVMDLFCDYNRLKRLLSLRWGIEVSDTLRLLRKWIPDKATRFVGPFSDEDFDSNMHVSLPPRGSYRHGIFEYARIVILPRPRPGKSFLFRKLMHRLDGKAPTDPEFWLKRKPNAAGSRFTVTSRNAMAVGESFSESEIWTSEYNECLPTDRPCGVEIHFQGRMIFTVRR